MATEEQIIQAIRLAVSSTMQAMISDLPALRSGAGKGDVEQIVKRIDTFKERTFRIGSSGLRWTQVDSINNEEDVSQDQIDFNSKVYYVLAQRTGGEAFDLVRNVTELNGGEAWRRLCKRFGGRTTGKRVHLTRKCVNPL